jgi:hypothetical protein
MATSYVKNKGAHYPVRKTRGNDTIFVFILITSGYQTKNCDYSNNQSKTFRRLMPLFSPEP